MFVLNDMRLDSRVRRAARVLAAAGRDVTVYAVLSDGTAGRGVEDVDGYRIVRMPMLMRPTVSMGAVAPVPGRVAVPSVKRVVATAFAATRPLFGGTLHFVVNWQLRWRRWARRVEDVVTPAAVWHAHDFNTLGVAARCAERYGGALVYDSHEVFLEAGAMSALPAPVRAALRGAERRMAARADAVITVNDSVADVLRTRLQRDDVAVVRNCSELAAGDSPLRNRLGLAPEVPLILYHGSIVTGRGLELLIRAIADARLGSAHLAYMGYGPLRPRLEVLARSSPAAERIHFLAPVAPDDVTTWVSGADVAAMPIEPTTLNHRLSSPNKLFEAIAAGVPVVGPDFVEFRRVVRDDPNGPLGALHVTHSPAEIASALASVINLPAAERDALRRRCRAAAAAHWSWPAERRRLLGIYAGLRADAHELVRDHSLTGAMVNAVPDFE